MLDDDEILEQIDQVVQGYTETLWLMTYTLSTIESYWNLQDMLRLVPPPSHVKMLAIAVTKIVSRMKARATFKR